MIMFLVPTTLTFQSTRPVRGATIKRLEAEPSS